MYRGIIYVQSTEMEESSARPYTKICRLVIREKSLFKHKELNLNSLVYTTYVKDMSNLHTYNTQTHK